MKLGVNSGSLTYQGFDVFQALDYAAAMRLDVLQIHRNQLDGYDPDRMRRVKESAVERGITLELSMGCIDRHASTFKPELGTAAEQLSAAIHAATYFGATAVQCFIGNLNNRLSHGPFEQRMADAGGVIKGARSLIRDTGVRVAIENHADSTARELAALIEDVGPEYAGVCLDTGNPVVIAEDPVLATEILAPYTLMTSIRDSLVWEAEDGATAQWVPLGTGNVDLRRVAALLRQHAPTATFCLELITAGAPKPVPYLDTQSELWQKVPHTPAPDFARFVGLARKGPAGPIEMVWRPERGAPQGELAAQLKAQQLRHYAEGFAYCREALGMGERSAEPLPTPSR
jgi:sugar phosphate isomerase/epimerase